MKKYLAFTSILVLFFTVNYSVRASILVPFPIEIESAVERGAFLGIDYEKVSLKKAEALQLKNKYGYFVKRVVANSAADRAGLQSFDYLYRIGDKEFDADYRLSDALDTYKEGDKVTIYFLRENKKRSQTVNLGSKDDSSNSYKENRKSSEKPFLGVSNRAEKRNYSIGGVPVNITKNSTADKLGLEDGDIITHLNQYRILDWGDITMALNTMDVGDKITIQYVHGALSKSASGQLESKTENREVLLGSNFEENMEKFERNMEEFGEKMEQMGEKIEEKAEIWSRKIEKKAEVWEEEIEERIEGKKGISNVHNKAFLGINSGHVSREKAQYLGFENTYGSYVENVIPNTAAQKAGLEIFDYIYGIDEYRTGKDQSLGDILYRYEPDNTANVILIRKGKKLSKTVTFGRKEEAQHSKTNKCDEPFLGVRLYHSDDYRSGNVLINPVEKSTASLMGLKKGDAITEINNYPIYDWSDVATAVDASIPGKIIKVTVLREGQKKALSGTLKSYKETKDCDEEEEEEEEDWSLNGTINGKEFHIDEQNLEEKIEKTLEKLDFDFNFDFDWNEEEEEVNENNERVDVSDMKVKMESLSQTDANEMQSKYGIEMPIVSNLKISEVSVFPNPSAGMFSLKFDLPQRGDTAIRVYNSLGREIYAYDLSDFTGSFEDNIDISQNGAGTYFLAVSQNGNVMTKKIILQRG